MKSLIYRQIVLVVLMATILLMVAPTSGIASSASFTIIQPEEAQDQTGKTYGEWSGAWWQYVLSIPSDDNPLLDGTGAKCGVGQAGSLFFLVGTDVLTTPSVTRNECEVPAEKYLFFPLLNIIWLKELDTENENNMRARLQSLVQSAKELHASIDGSMVSLNPHTTPYRTESPEGLFTVTVPEDAVFGIDPGIYDAVADGFYLMVAPLSPGPHTINFGGTSAAYGFTLDVTYNLNVQP